MRIRKTLVSLLLTLVAVLPLAAQNNPKKVAVWETKCSDGSLSYMQRHMIHTSMVNAVVNIAGYAVCDRSAFDTIMKEHNFQRSGAASGADIIKMGQMVAAQYIIVPEAMVDANEIYISVRMLDVETGFVAGMQSTLCASAPDEIQKASAKLVASLLDRAVEESDTP